MKYVFLIAFFISIQINAQNFDNFKVLSSKGDVPEEFNKASSDKVQEEIKGVSKKQSYADRKTEESFILQNNYLIDQMLTSGAVLYNEELSNYVSKVADEVLKNDKELRSQLRFYIIKTPVVNAFSTDRGTIFITAGLLAQIENEAQLAFVLSHEIVHYLKKHAKTGFIENEKIEQGKGEYKRVKWDKELSKSKYSKELELEADVEGLKIYFKTNYSLNEINGVFYVLQYAHLPIEDIPFDTTYFNRENFSLPNSCFLDKIEEIKAIDDDEDEYSSHPNINKRRAVIADEIEGKSNKGRVAFINDEKSLIRYTL